MLVRKTLINGFICTYFDNYSNFILQIKPPKYIHQGEGVYIHHLGERKYKKL